MSLSTLIDQTLSELLPLNDTPQTNLYAAARYAICEGKRLRPLLTLSVASIYGFPLERALHPACALELIHTYSLIHDDLPCMDNDDFRRGRPTLHCAYAEGHAVLVGDFLLTYAFEILSSAPHLKPETRLELISLLAKSAGGDGMIAGQVVDLQYAGKPMEASLHVFMHQKKTAQLIQTALLFGAILGDAPSSDYATLQEIGNHLGLAYQLQDDLEDSDGALPKEEIEFLLEQHQTKAIQLIQTLSLPALPLLEMVEKMFPQATHL